MKRAIAERDVRLVLVTSALPGEGKSTVSVNLARTAAADRRVLLIDADLRRPSLTTTLGLRAAAGLSDVIAGHCELQDALRKDPRTGCSSSAARTACTVPTHCRCWDRPRWTRC